MVIELPSIEKFAAEAKEAGALRAYVTCNIEYWGKGGIPYWRAEAVATAVGTLACDKAGASPVLLKYRRDFGPVPEDLATRAAPQAYQEKVEAFLSEVRARLAEAGFSVRDGEITQL